MIVFDRLWQTMKRKGFTKYRLIHEYGISPGQLTRLKRNQNVNTNTIDTLCNILDCDLNDVMERKK